MRRIDPPGTHRRLVTPEGVALAIELGGVGERAGAFLIDAAITLGVLIAMSIGIALALRGSPHGWTGFVIVWLLGAFVLRNFWFTGFEAGRRGATPGKRMMGLRVIARDGARLTFGAVVVRNAMRELEIFLPLTFLARDASENGHDALFALFALSWTGLFLLFPLLNRDRLRVGDLIAGTLVARIERRALADDLGGSEDGAHRRFPATALAVYGVDELQTLEDVLRRGDADSIATVAGLIQTKAHLPHDDDAAGFLRDYYAALCTHLERRIAVGQCSIPTSSRAA